MPSSLLIVGAGPAQIRGIRVARQMGFSVVAMDGDPEAPGLKEADVAVVHDVKDSERAIEIAMQHRIAGVTSFSIEVALRTVAAVAQRLKLPGLSTEAAENATNKHRMRELWQKAGLASPASIPCHGGDAALHAAGRIGYPVVVKPSDSSGSRGVSLVTGEKEIPAAFEHALHHSRCGLVLVEEFMPGVEMSVESFVQNGRVTAIALSDKIRTRPPYLLDTTVSFPSIQDEAVQKSATELVAVASLALGIDNAPVHAEVMVTPRGPMMVELAARGPGFKVFTDMIPWTSGVDVVGNLIRMAVGQGAPCEPAFRRGAVLRFPESRPGLVKSVDGVERARLVPDVTDLEINVRPGDHIRPLKSGSDRIGHIISLAETREEAERAVRTAEAMLHIEVDDNETR